MISISATIPDIRKLGDKLLPTPKDMLLLAGDAMDIIKKRTMTGTDVNGSPFAAYSTEYAKYKKRAGRTNKKGLNANAEAVNLTFTGRMMGGAGQENTGLGTEEIPNGARVFFRDADRAPIAYYHNTGAGRLPKREFFGLSDAEFKQITEKLFTRMRARAK